MKRETTVYKQFASTVEAWKNCQKTHNAEWEVKHMETLHQLAETFLPHGTNGPYIDLDHTKPEKLVFRLSYHHMNKDGYYDGWTDHVVTVYPSLAFDIRLVISGQNKRDVKEILHADFEYALTRNIMWNDGEHTFWTLKKGCLRVEL